MELTAYIKLFKQYLSEFLTPIDNETISIRKNKTAAYVRFAVIVPTIYLLTFLSLVNFKKTAYAQAACNTIFMSWIVLFIIYIALNVIIARTRDYTISRLLTYICVFLELFSNQIIVYATGSLTSHAVLFLPICVCIYRIFFDYNISLFSAISASCLLITAVVLEFFRIVPLSPYLASPIAHQAYFNPTVTVSFVTAIIMGLFITFFAVNFSINQKLKLNRYILDNWKNDLDSLHEFSQSMTAATDFDDIITQSFKAIIQAKVFDMAALMVLNKTRLVVKSSFGWKHNWLEKYAACPLFIDSPVLKQLFEQKKLLVRQDINKYPDLAEAFNGLPVKSVYMFPFIYEKQEYGALIIANENTGIVSSHKLQLLSSITGQIDMAFQNYMNLTREMKRASIDGLTGLYNRRTFDEQLDAAVSEALANNTQLSLLILDTDDFKDYNDTYGHPAGDRLLKIISDTAAGCIRSTDIAARYGGEEFAFILKETDLNSAVAIAERIRSSIEAVSSEDMGMKVTVSIGVGTLPDGSGDIHALIEAADKSLYIAKRSGKNRVCCISSDI